MANYTIGETKRYIYHCRRCNITFAYDFLVTGFDRRGYPKWQILNPPEDASPERLTMFPAFWSCCPKCNGVTTKAEVKGVVTDCECNENCTHALGWKCHCSCGGKNHGAAWLAVDVPQQKG